MDLATKMISICKFQLPISKSFMTKARNTWVTDTNTLLAMHRVRKKDLRSKYEGILSKVSMLSICQASGLALSCTACKRTTSPSTQADSGFVLPEAYSI